MKFYISILLLFTINRGIAQNAVKEISQTSAMTTHATNASIGKKISNVPSNTTQYINRLSLMKNFDLSTHRNNVHHNTDVPIKDGLVYLLFAGTGLAFYMFYKYEEKVTPTEE